MGKHLEQALPSVYTLQCLTGKVDNNNNKQADPVESSRSFYDQGEGKKLKKKK